MRNYEVHLAIESIDRINKFILTLRQLTDADTVAIQKVCRNELAYLQNKLTPTILKRTISRYRSVVQARLGKNHLALQWLTLNEIDEVN